MSTACAYREGNTNGPMYDSQGKKCDTLDHTTKILLIAGCSAAGAALVGLGIYWLIRRARINARRSQVEDVPARPLSAWVGRPGTTMAQTNGYDTDGIDYQKYAARSRASSYANGPGPGPDGTYSPLGFAEDHQHGMSYGQGGMAPPSPQMYRGGQHTTLNYQQGSYDPAVSPTKEDGDDYNGDNNDRRSYYDAAPRGLPVPPQMAMAGSSRRYSQTEQDVGVYSYNGDDRGRSPSPRDQYGRGGAVSPSAYYSQRRSGEYGQRQDGGYTLEGEHGRERVEMLSPDPRYIQSGR